MKRCLLLLLLPFGAGVLSAATLDLTPRPALAAGDGMEQPIITFRKGQGCVALLKMNKWTCAGDAASVTFSQQDASQASLKLSLVPKPLALDDPTAPETVKQMLLATVPGEAVDIKIVTEGRDALSINGWKSVDAHVTFNYYGNLFHRSLSLWTQSPDTQLQVVVSSFERDYEKIGKSALRFLFTWSEIPAEQMNTLKFNTTNE